MGLQKYTVNVNGVQTILKLSDEEAERMGLTPSKPVQEKQAAPPQNKQRSWARNKKK